jgi:pyruvate ferredoxin oxidoreductase delta subunit
MKLEKGHIAPSGRKLYVMNTGDWRSFQPVLNLSKCRRCGTCWINCPTQSVNDSGRHFRINLDYCKGCGVCAEECPFGAILMVEERRE